MSDMAQWWGPGLLAVCLGAGVGMSLWLLMTLVLAVPGDDSQWRDRPPVAFRLCWPMIRIMAWYLPAWLPSRTLERLESRLQHAGLDYVLTAPQFAGSQVVGAGIGLTAGWGIARLAEWDAAGLCTGLGVLGMMYPRIWLAERIQARRKDLLKTLPFYLDIITLCVEAGLNLNGALKQATHKGPPGALRDELQRVLRDLRAGKPRADALRAWAARVGEASVSNLVAGILQAETLGMSLGPMLRIQAEQRRQERFLRAEKLAMEAPVKMLFPLVAFIFPCTFVVLGFPIYVMFKEM